MNARRWHGMVPGSTADEYLMRSTCAAPSSGLRVKIEGHSVCMAQKQI
jgi:hypothetical protein